MTEKQPNTEGLVQFSEEIIDRMSKMRLGDSLVIGGKMPSSNQSSPKVDVVLQDFGIITGIKEPWMKVKYKQTKLIINGNSVDKIGYDFQDLGGHDQTRCQQGYASACGGILLEPGESAIFHWISNDESLDFKITAPFKTVSNSQNNF